MNREPSDQQPQQPEAQRPEEPTELQEAQQEPPADSQPQDWRSAVVHGLLNPTAASADTPDSVQNQAVPAAQSDDDATPSSPDADHSASAEPVDGSNSAELLQADEVPEPAVVPAPTNRRERRRAEKRQAAAPTVREDELAALRTQLKSPTPRRGRRTAHRWVGTLSRAIRADGYPGDLERATRGVQQPVTTGRRIVVISTEGGAGRSTAVATLAQIYGALRTDRVCALDLASAPSPLGDRLAVDTPVSAQEAIGAIVLNHPSTPEDMGQVFAQPKPGVWVAHADSHEEPLTELEVEELLTQVSRQCGVTVVECPPVLEDPRTQSALEMAHAVLVIGSTTGNGLHNAMALHDLLAADPDRRHLPLATVLNDHSSDNPWSRRELRRSLDQRGRIHHSMSYDRHLSTGREIHIDHLDERHRLEWVRLAATALTLARGYGAAR